MEPIATYRERRKDGWRVFELFADQVRVRGKSYFEGEFELTHPLAALEPVVDKVWARAGNFWFNFVTAAATAVIPGVLITVYLKGTEYFLLVALVALGLVMGISTRVFTPKIEFASFQTAQGVRVLFVGRTGPDKGGFDAFVQQVSDQIASARTSGAAAPPGGSGTP